MPYSCKLEVGRGRLGGEKRARKAQLLLRNMRGYARFIKSRIGKNTWDFVATSRGLWAAMIGAARGSIFGGPFALDRR